MAAVIQFFIDLEGWVYLVAGLVIIIFTGRLIHFIQKWKLAQFGLEREIARKKIMTSVTTLILCLVLIIAELFFTSYASAALVSMRELATPTISFEPTPTVPFNLGGASSTAGDASVEIASTAETSGCIPGQLEWISPAANDEVRGTVQLIGTVNVVNMGFFTYEFRSATTESWTTIAGGNTTVIENDLGGSWDTASIIPGDYLLRLVVSDNQGVNLPACIIPIRIVAP